MVDLDALYRRLEHASFTQREQIAGEVVRESTPEEILPLVRGLEHPIEPVRLGIIEILRRASCREALRKLVEHANTHQGNERVFTVRAISYLAQATDDFLLPHVKKWLALEDQFLEPHARKISSVIRSTPASGIPVVAPPSAAPSAPLPSGGSSRVVRPVRTTPLGGVPIISTNDRPSSPVPTYGRDSLEGLVVALFSATKGAERILIVEQIEKRGPQALAAAAKLVLAKGNEHLVAYIARAAIRHASQLPSPEKLIPLFEAARKRLGVAPIAHAAIDDALLALGGLTLSPALLSRIVEMDKPQVDAVVARLGEREATEVALHVPALLDALAKKPALWTSLGPALVYAASHLRESTRVELRRLTDVVIDDLRHGKQHPPITVVSACWVLAKIADPGEPLPRHLRLAIDRVAAVEAASALCALCSRLATEEAAATLLTMLRDPLADARASARDAIQSWQSPWIAIEGDRIVPKYVDEKGHPLERRADKLVVPMSGEEYVLDGKGRPTRHGDTDAGGCLCCAPPRALVRRRTEGLRCPATWQSHLRDGGRTLFEKDHALGRCKRCDSVRPRVRDGARVICLDCGAGIPADEIPILPAPQQPAVPSEHGRAADEDALPRPPSKDELEHVAAHIRAAIKANVFLNARDGDQRWNGSGIIIARDGNHIAILTNRHVVESDAGKLAAIDAMTVSGEAIRVSCIWRAKKGVDLALVEARVEHPENIGLMQLGTGVGLVGAEVFAIGNPLGLAWTYSRGTLSAIRHWTTQEGQSVRILQTDANIAPGSSGGGLFHSDGHLLGVMSFLRQGYAGGSAHFALSIDAIREAFAREDVRWHGAALADLPK